MIYTCRHLQEFESRIFKRDSNIVSQRLMIMLSSIVHCAPCYCVNVRAIVPLKRDMRRRRRLCRALLMKKRESQTE